MGRLLSLFLIFTANLFSQITLHNEEVIGGKYRLLFANSGYSFSLIEKEGKRTLAFSGLDEADGNLFPTRNLFIALPSNARPSIHGIILKERPVAIEGIQSPSSIGATFFEIKGYVWVGNNYCVRIVVNPFFMRKNRLTEIVEFRIDIDLDVQGSFHIKQNASQSSTVIDNPLYGSQWKDQNPSYSIQRTDLWINYNNNYVKLGVVADGIYRIRYDELVSYGVPVASIDPKTLKIYLKGKEVPIYVSGENDNIFDQQDFIEFIGRRNYGDVRYRGAAPFDSPYYEYLNSYSDTTIYWLTWSGTAGARVDTIAAVAGPVTETLRYYDRLMHTERDLYWDYSLSGGDVRRNLPEMDENETWVEAAQNVGKSSVSFTVTDLFPNKPSRAFAKLQDYASSIASSAHNLALSINSTATKYDSGFINKYQVKTLQASFLSTVLKNGSNTVDIHSFTVAGNSVNTIARDWCELEYPRYLKAVNDSLYFAYNNLGTPVVAAVAVTGLISNPFSLYKFILSDSSILKITNFSRSNDTLRFVDSVRNGTYYFLLRENKIPAPIFIYKKKFVNLRDHTRQADYIAITHPVLLSAASAYTSFIVSKYGVTTSLVNINDIYDEFNYGFFAPEPIREFLKSTHEYWQAPKPKYVFLIGKATYDFYGNKTKYFGAPNINNFVPSYGNPVSDNWFVMWDTTGALIPQMNIGRLPAKSVEELQAYTLKHQKYTEKGYDDWNKRYLFFAGGNFTDPDQIVQSKGVNDYIIDHYVAKPPIGGSVANFYKTTEPVTNFGPYSPEYIKDAIDQGGVFISYIGHSGTQTWDNSITDISQLANIRDRNPMISDFGCSTAKFAEPDIQSFSELAVSSQNGQAISYIGNSSLGFTSTAYSFPQVFYKKLLIDTSASLGDVHRLAKLDYIKQFGTSGSYGLFMQTNTLIGDPIVKLPIPTKPNLSLENADLTLQPEFPTDRNDSITFSTNYFNYGAVAGDSLTLSIRDEFQGSVHFSKTVKRPVPLYTDSFVVSIPVKGLPGEHTLTILIDSANTVDELSENDNALIRKIVVATTTIRNLTGNEMLNQTDGKIVYLNPSVRPPQQYFFVDVSEQQSFTTKETSQIPYDTFATTATLDPKYQGKRIWIRPKYDETTGEGLAYSYRVGEKTSFLLNDSVAFNELQMEKVAVHENLLRMDSTRITFDVISAGFNDGNTAVISKNGQNFVPENTLRGHHAVLFDAATFQYIGNYRFDVAGGSANATSYKNFLDTLNSNYIVCIGVSDEGSQNLSAALKTSIKTLGSRYIDSLKFRGSWSMIGRKGAAPGSVPEKFSNPFQGRVQIDTTIVFPDTMGTFETPEFGPVAAWKNIDLSYSIPAGGTIGLNVLGINDSGVDTISHIVLSQSVIDLSSVNTTQYPRIKLAGMLATNSNSASPSLSSIEINYDALPELGTNYQAVKSFLLQDGNVVKELASTDSVLQGEKVRFTYRMYNAGGSTAKNISSKIISIWENNYSEQVAAFVVDSLPPLSYKELSAEYNTALGFGKRNVQFVIDSDTAVKEIYKDNNLFVFPIYIKKDETLPVLPNLSITREKIVPAVLPITDEADSVEFRIVYQNTGAVVNDSISVSMKHLYRNSLATEWLVRRKYPAISDTITVQVPILRRAGEHQLQVELDPVGLVTETSESDNTAAYYFTVATTSFKIIQPNQFTTSSFQQMLFLNPTETAGAASRVALLELDSLPNYSTANQRQIPMLEFTTLYNIASLAKGKRYYWRIKEQGSTRDWTTGTFFLGTDTIYALGQSDSAGWGNNTFIHTAYQASTGAEIVDTKYFIEILSAGFNDGRTGRATVNGLDIISPVLGAGHNVAVLDTANFAVMELRRFDVSNNPADSDSLEQFISSIPSGRVVIDLIVDDGSNNLQQSARNALKTIGSSYIDQVGWRDSWAIIGRKGAAPGSVPESYKLQATGAAAAESTITKKEYSGTVTTPLVGNISGLSNFNLQSTIPAGTALTTTLIGFRSNGTVDSVQLSPVAAANALSVHSVNSSADHYSNAKLLFELKTTNQSSPSVKSWSFALVQPTELAVSARATFLDRTQVMEGEDLTFNSKIYNVGIAAVESSLASLTISHLGISTSLQETILPKIAGGDSLDYSLNFNTRGKKGDYAFIFEIVPKDSINEINRNNNTVTLPFTVIADSVKPQIKISFDGREIVNGDYVSQYPEVRIRYTDNNPSQLLPVDTNNFKIRLNNELVHFMPGTAELVDISTGTAEVRWTPVLPKGENVIEFSASDISGNYSDTAVFYVNVDSDFKLLDVYNLPNPFNSTTHFTFNLAGPAEPDEVIIKLYTVAGRLIHEIHSLANVGFNKIFWDGRDRDGDEIGNGVYLYRVIVKGRDKQATATSKLVKMK